MNLVNEAKFFQQLRELGWSINGSLDIILNGNLDRTLDLEIHPHDSRLNAIIRIKNCGSIYKVGGALYDSKHEEIVPVRYVSPDRGDVLSYLETKIIGVIDAYFTGLTNDEHILEIRERHKIQPIHPTL